jgi:cyclophilin family peptidyl-prolyl cis-trans isomerase
MSTKNIWVSVIIAIIIIAVAWFFLDHRSGYPKGPDELMNVVTTTAPVASSTPVTSANQSVKNFMHTITIQTSKGTIVFETYDVDAPKTSANFISLANKGFYNGLIFHRVIEGFMIQGGDPTGTGSGGPGYTIPDELNPNTVSFKNGYMRGVVAMANTGQPNSGGSQFFIMQNDRTDLTHTYSIFGKVISGMDVVDAIAATPVNASDKPLTDVVMTKVTVGDNK